MKTNTISGISPDPFTLPTEMTEHSPIISQNSDESIARAALEILRNNPPRPTSPPLLEDMLMVEVPESIPNVELNEQAVEQTPNVAILDPNEVKRRKKNAAAAKYRRENPETIKKTKANSYLKNQTKIKATQAIYDKTHKEQISTQKKRHYNTHKRR